MSKNAVKNIKERALLLEILTKLNVDVLINRLEISNVETKQFFEEKLFKMKSGIVGEDRLNKIFNHYQFPFPYQVLKGVSLDSGGKFQTDCLILTPNLIILLESKNISGKLYFESNPERLVREKENGLIDVYESPEVQVERNVTHLKMWLEEHGLKIPVVGAFILTSAKHPIVVKEPLRIQALFPKSVFSYVHQQWNQYRNRKQFLSIDGMEKLREMIELESVKNRYEQFPLRKRWSFENVKLVQGVRCCRCNKIGMTWISRSWECKCGYKDKDAHIPTLQEWFIFNKNTITNKECREYLMIDSRHVIKRLLKHKCILEIGNTKGTNYKWNW